MEKEKIILKLIRFFPIVFIILISFLLIYFISIENPTIIIKTIFSTLIIFTIILLLATYFISKSLEKLIDKYTNKINKTNLILNDAQTQENREDAEILLLESAEQYKLLMQQAPFAMAIFDEKGFLIEVNNAHKKLWGFDTTKLINKFNILKDTKFSETKIQAFVKRAYKGEIVEIPSHKFNPSVSISTAEGLGVESLVKTQIYPLKDNNEKVKNIVITIIDLSLEEEGNKNNRILHSVFQTIPDLLFIMKKDGTIIDYRANKKSELYISPKVFLNKKMQDLLPEVVADTFKENIKKLSKHDDIKVFRYSLVIKKKVKYYEARISYLAHDEDIMTIVRDITEQVFYEEQLKFQAQLLEQSVSAIGVVDGNGFFTYVNEEHVKMWRYNSKEEMIGTSPSTYCVDKKLFEDIIKKIKKGGEITFQFKALRKDDTVFDALIAVKHIKILEKTFYIGSAMDISKVLEQEKFIKAISETAPAIIYVFDFTKKNMAYHKGKNVELLGYSTDEIIKMEKSFFEKLIHPDDLQRVEDYQTKIINAKKDDVFEIEYRMKHKNGKWVSLHSYERPFLYNQDGTLQQKIGIALDVTELRDKEQLFLYQSRLAATGEMIDNIAHQWRQPLSAISTAATGARIQKEMDSLSDEDLFYSLDAINTSAQFLSQTIEDFRGFFKPNKEKTEFRIKKSINKLMTIIESKLKNRLIEVIKNIEDIEIYGHENELIQVLMNILSNSIDALENTVQEDKYIFITVSKENENIIISIKDNAFGIPFSIKDKIFESRFTTKEKGTGIGLYMSKNIINNFNGSLEFENVEYNFNAKNYIGANFIITLKE